MSFTKDELVSIVGTNVNKKDVFSAMGYSSLPNNRTVNKIKDLFKSYGLDLDEMIKSNLNMELFETKTCPVCSGSFKVSKKTDKRRPKITCSYACSNVKFRKGENNGSHRKAVERSYLTPDRTTSVYRTICFANHDKKCIVCDEENIVTVHHYDENHKNNAPENLVPLCPTHHTYIHSNFKYLVKDKVDDYVDKFKKSRDKS